MECRTCACGLRLNLSHVHSESLVKVALYELESSFLKLSRFETPKVSNIWSYFRFLSSAREFVLPVTRSTCAMYTRPNYVQNNCGARGPLKRSYLCESEGGRPIFFLKYSIKDFGATVVV